MHPSHSSCPKLANKKQNVLSVADVPSAIESVLSLLYVVDEEYNCLGLLFVKKLTHDNCNKICKARDLLDKIIDLFVIGVGTLLSSVSNISAVLQHTGGHLEL